jgi:hypothetical protein
MPEPCERLLPAAARAGGAEPAVDQRPALRVVDRVAVHVVERPGQGLRDAVDAAAEIADLELAPRARAQGAFRPSSTNEPWVTGIAASKWRSTAAA